MTIKDPVCGMEIESANAAGTAEYEGQTYSFCSEHCRQKFLGSPEQYAGPGAPGAAEGHGPGGGSG